MKIGILGGGLSGLILGKKLTGHEVEILESSSQPGGLCRSFEQDGFRGDYGGHILFSKDKESLSFLINSLGDNAAEIKRENRIFYKQSFVKYPFENDLFAIPVKDRYECLYNFLYNNYPEPSNLEEWCYYTFGKGIAEKYLLPYNRKIWKFDASKLSMSWVERVPKPPKEDVIKSALGITTEGYTHQLYFNYPIKGGIEALIKSLAEGLNINTDFHVSAVEKTDKRWSVISKDGKSRNYDHIISTIPVFDLFNAIKDVDADINAIVNELKYNSLIVVMICLNRPRKHNFSALYIPDPNIIFHRLCYMDYFSSNNSPEGCSSILAEITASNDNEIGNCSDNKIKEIVVNDLSKIGQIDKKDVVGVVLRRQKYAYVINDLLYEYRLQKIYAYLRKLNISFCGRFAEFRYYNMDDCVRSAFKVAEKIDSFCYSEIY